MSLFWPDTPVDTRVPNPQTDEERAAYAAADAAYAQAKGSFIFGATARLFGGALIAGWLLRKGLR